MFLKELHLLKVFFRVSLRFLSMFMQGLLQEFFQVFRGRRQGRQPFNICQPLIGRLTTLKRIHVKVQFQRTSAICILQTDIFRILQISMQSYPLFKKTNQNMALDNPTTQILQTGICGWFSIIESYILQNMNVKESQSIILQTQIWEHKVSIKSKV